MKGDRASVSAEEEALERLMSRGGEGTTQLSLSLEERTGGGGWGRCEACGVMGQQEERDEQRFPRRKDFPVSTEAGRSRKQHLEKKDRIFGPGAKHTVSSTISHMLWYQHLLGTKCVPQIHILKS